MSNTGPLLLLMASMFLFLGYMGVPVAFAIMAGVLVVTALTPISMQSMIGQMFHGIDAETLLAIPFFLLVGELMSSSDVTQRLIRLAQVMVVNHQPVRIASQSISERIVMAKGPWRTSGDWWAAEPWNRDEWDVALESGALYRLFQDARVGGRWFIEGSYD